MRIAFIGHKRIPGGEGGVEVVVEELATRMAAQGHQVTVYNRFSKGMPRLQSYEGVRIINVPTINSKSLDALIYSFLATFHALFGRFDVIHYHSIGPCVPMFLPRLLGRRLVATVHGLNWQSGKWGRLAMRYLRMGEWMLSRCAHEVITLSHQNQNYYREQYRRNSSLIPNGIEPAVCLPPDQIRELYGLQKKHYILFLSRIVPEKGLHYLLNAYARLDTDMPLVIAGGDSHANDYYSRMMLQAASDPRVICTGFVSGRVKQELYANCYLYVLPSDSEGMPLSILEAKSYGAPCLVSDIEGTTEAMLGQGATFRHSDENSLYEALKSLLETPPPPTTLAGHLSWDEVVELTLSLYKA